MKPNRILLLAALSLLLPGACIKTELKNTEADIIKCILPEDILKSEPKITNTDIMVLIFPDKADITRLSPEFELTPGASINPPSGTERDFSDPQTYEVTSEDGQWKKVYSVRITTAETPTRFDFENWEKDQTGRYEFPYEIGQEENGQQKRLDIWDSGNAGFALTGGGSTPDKYPTCSTTDAYSGKFALKLETRLTGSFGANLKMPIAPGNLFIGSFDVANATREPLKATKFGMPFPKKPVAFRGYYRYISGGNVTDNEGNLVIPLKRDQGNIYAVLYETDENTPCLDGTNGQTSPNIIARAVLDNLEEGGKGYTPFDIRFEYLKPFDPEKSKNSKYSISMVFTSSIRGDIFEGAVGSTLYVDQIEIVTEGAEE